MQSPALPADETDRIATLRALGVLDTPPEERFDRLTRLAKRMFGTQIALISLVDADRQWFKSCDGLDATQTSREVSFCGHAILEDEIMVVPDASLDERFRDNPLVTGSPHIRFYAGRPLVAPDGTKLGTLCIIDRDPRTFGDDDRALLDDLACTAEQELSAVRLATLDDLTLLPNRRGFAAFASNALALCDRLGQVAALLSFDLNLFKQINDRLGHAAGDMALRDFSRLLTHNFRTADVVARIGGDEFSALLAGVEGDGVEIAERRLRRAVARHNAESGRDYQLAYSAGSVLRTAGSGVSIDDLLALADAQMYVQKRRQAATDEPFSVRSAIPAMTIV
jgi:diguanylate cyclase (GGDEF)-like protein